MKWLDAASLRIGNMLWIIILVKGNCDGKISSDKVCEIVDKIAKTRTFELYFASYINVRSKVNKRRYSCGVSVFIEINSNILRCADCQIFRRDYKISSRLCNDFKLEKIYLVHRAPKDFLKHVPYLSLVFRKLTSFDCRNWSRGLIRYIFVSMFSCSFRALVGMQIPMPCILSSGKEQKTTKNEISCKYCL